MSAQRKFDWETAADMYWRGDKIQSIADFFGVAASSVRRVVVPGELNHHQEKNRARIKKLAACDRCGGEMRAFSRARGSRVCMKCAAEARIKTVRPDELQCWRCKQWKPDEGFHRSSRSAHRRFRASECVQCRSQKNRNAKTAV